MSAEGAVPSRPQLAERILGGSAHIGEQPVGELRPLAEEQLRSLRSLGARAGMVIAVEETAPHHFVGAVLAAWALDAIPLPCKTIEQTPLADSAFTVRATGQVQPPSTPQEMPGLGSTAVLHLTSGSTGRPKLARRGVPSMLNELEGYRLGLPLAADDRVYVPIPITHSYGWGVALGALLAGATLDATPLVHARRAAARLEAATVAAITAPVASLLGYVPRSAAVVAPRLRVVMVGASRVTAAIDDAFYSRFAIRLSRNYGSSETGATFMGPGGLPEGAVGVPMHGNTILAPKPGEQGELLLELPPVEGHLGAPGPAVTCWPTGDIVRRDATGTVTFISRARSATRLNDRNVDVYGLERALRGLPAVEDVYPLVLSRPDGESEDLYTVVAGAGVDPDIVEQRRLLFPDGTKAVRLVYCERLPLTATGKVDRSLVMELIDAQRSPR